MNGSTLWYVADPMCSWCWGFSPVIEAIRLEFSGQLAIELLVGGLRAGTIEPLTPEKRAEILHHWHNVQRVSGQPFTFEDAMPEGFVYDTEPACRAVVSASFIDRASAFPYLAAIQYAFYVKQANVTQPTVLIQLATDLGLPAAQFSRVLTSTAARQATQNHFRQVSQWGVSGFPSILAQGATGLHLLTNGYCKLEVLRERLVAWLKTADS